MINFLDDTFLLEDYSCEGTRWFPIFQTAKFVKLLSIYFPPKELRLDGRSSYGCGTIAIYLYYSINALKSQYKEAKINPQSAFLFYKSML